MMCSEKIKTAKNTFIRLGRVGLMLMLFSVTACRRHNDIHLEKVQQTSNRLTCDKIFANNRKEIIEMNEILIQTGSIDSIEDRTVKASIIHHQGKEIILNLVKVTSSNNKVEEFYAGNGYKLELIYRAKTIYYSVNYEGECQIWHGKSYAKFDVAGTQSML